MKRSQFSIRLLPSFKEQLEKITKHMGKAYGTEISMGQAMEIMANETLQQYERKYLDSQFFVHTENGWQMTEEGLQKFVVSIDRVEARGEVPGNYMKAVQATLHTLGFDPDWVERTLWSALYEYYYKDGGQPNPNCV